MAVNGGGLFGAVSWQENAIQRVFARGAERWRTRAARRALIRGQREVGRTLARTRLEAELAARLAVRSGVRLDDFLRYRLARYAGRLPVPLEALPVDLDVQDGEVVARVRPAPPRAPAPPQAQVPEPGSGAQRAAEAALAEIGGRLIPARAHAEALARTISQDLAAGALPADPEALAATPEQRGRPPVPLPMPALLLRTLAGALLAAETLRLAGPALRSAGAPADLSTALAEAPAAAAAGLGFALGGAVALFALVGAGLERWSELLAGAGERRRALIAAAAIGGGAAALAVAAAALSDGRFASLVLVAAVPFAAVLLLRRAATLAAQREVALKAALAWDHAQASETAERVRRGEALSRALAAVEALESEQSGAERKLRELEREAAEVGRNATLAAAARTRWLERVAESLAAALELDRYAYLRRRSATAEMARPVLAPRPTRVEADRLGMAS